MATAPAGPKPRRVVKTIALGCGGLIGLALLLIIGMFVWQTIQSGNLLESAKANQAAGNYQAAAGELRTLIADYQAFDEADEAKQLLPQLYLEWAAALREEALFEESLVRYDEVTDSQYTEPVAEGKRETRLAWGEALVAEQNFAQALAQVEQVLQEVEANGTRTDEGSTAQADRASAALPDVYVGLANQAREAGDVETAYERLNFVLENYETGAGHEKAIASFTELAEAFYNTAQQERSNAQYVIAEDYLLAIVTFTPDIPVAAQVQKEFPAFYFEWGQALMDAPLYSDAIIILEHLVIAYPDSELSAQANATLVDAQVAAITSSGAAGELPAPQTSGESSGGELVLYDVTNDTICPIIVLMSGPESKATTFDAQTNLQVELPAGSYNIVVQTDDSQELVSDCQNITPFTTESAFESGIIYYSSFYIASE